MLIIKQLYRLRRVVTLLAAVALFATACGNGASPSPDTTDGATDGGTNGEQVTGTIGLSMHFLADDYAKEFQATVEEKAAEFGHTVMSASADGDPNKQLSDIESFVTQGVDAIIVIPIDEVGVVPALRSADEAGIPILSASPVPEAEEILTAVVGPSDFENGKAACEDMIADMESRDDGTDVAISTASVTLYRIDQRELGCRDALSEAGATVVDVQKGLSPEEALAIGQNLLSAHPELDGIFASFSNLVIGAGQAVKDADKVGQVSVSGIDADRAIIQLICEGAVTSVGAQFPSQQAELITIAADDVINGRDVDPDQQDQLPTRTVTADNAEERYQEIWGDEFSC